MIALDAGEDVEMRLRVKCSGRTRKFGGGVFVMTNRRVLYESRDDGLCLSHPVDMISGVDGVGEHEFCLRWLERNRPHSFQARIQRHYGRRPASRDVRDRWVETLASRHPRHYDGWRCSEDGTVSNFYMPEYDGNIRTGEYAPEMEELVGPFKRWADQWTINIGSGRVPMAMYSAVSRLWHAKELETAKGLKGDTYEDQRFYRRCMRHLACAGDRNYQSLYGMMPRSLVRLYFGHFLDYLQRDAAFYGEMAQMARAEAARAGGGATPEARGYGGYGARLEGLYGYERDAWVWLGSPEAAHRRYVREPLDFTGTPGQFLDRMEAEHVLRRRTYEILARECGRFSWMSNFWFRAYEVYGSLKRRRASGGDVGSYVPPAGFRPRMLAAEMKIKEFEGRLREPL